MAAVPNEDSIRMIVQRGPAGRDWSAWLDGHPEQAAGGHTVMSAVNRWLQLNSDRFPGPFATRINEEKSSLDHRVVILSSVARCPECGGTGRYVGLTVIETCRKRDGTGLVSSESAC